MHLFSKKEVRILEIIVLDHKSSHFDHMWMARTRPWGKQFLPQSAKPKA